MRKRFENELEFRLDQVTDRGATYISTPELYRWFERTRITRSVWEDIEARWQEREQPPLFVGNNEHGYTFIWGEGLTADDDAFFRPIGVLAGTD